MKLTVPKVAAALRKHRGNVRYAARQLNCSRMAVYGFIRARPALQVVLRDCREGLKDVGESVLTKAVLAGEPWAVTLFLKTQARDRGYADTIDILLRKAVEAVENMTDDELLAYGARRGLTGPTGAGRNEAPRLTSLNGHANGTGNGALPG